MRNLRDAAVEYASRYGWHVLPLKKGAKQPATTHGKDDATDDPISVFEWWQPTLQQIREYNIGLNCATSGLVVIDIDPRHGGDETFYELERRLGKLPTTVSALTGGGGAHFFFKDPGVMLRGQLGPGVDVKSSGYVLLWPSVHPSGTRYEWDNAPEEIEVAELPEKWVNAMEVSQKSRETHGASSRTPDPITDPLFRIPAHQYIHKLTGRTPDRRGWYQCPFHSAGQERTPSLKADGPVWSCFACPVPPGKRTAGGGIIDFTTLLLGFAIPPRGGDYLEVKSHLLRTFR